MTQSNITEAQKLHLESLAEKKFNNSKLFLDPLGIPKNNSMLKLYPQHYNALMEGKRLNIQRKPVRLQHLTKTLRSNVDMSKAVEQQLETSQRGKPLLKRPSSVLHDEPLPFWTTMHGISHTIPPACSGSLQQLIPKEKQTLAGEAVVADLDRKRQMPGDLFCSPGLPFIPQSPFAMSQLQFPPVVLNPQLLNFPQIATQQTEQRYLPSMFSPQGLFYNPTQATEFPTFPTLLTLPNTFWPVPSKAENLRGMKMSFENSSLAIQKPVRPFRKRPTFYCRDCKTTFEATILKKSNSGAVVHRCSFVGRPITRRVGIRSKVCKGKHAGSCIIPLAELTEVEKAIDVAKKTEKLVTSFCHNVDELRYIKRYAQYPPLCRIRVWRLPESIKWGSKNIEYYDCQCNQLYPPVANIEVAKKHASTHDAAKNCCDICGKRFTHHLQVNAHKKVHKVHLNKIRNRDGSLCGILSRETDQTGTLPTKRQKIYHEETLPKPEPTPMPFEPIAWPPAMFCNPPFFINGGRALKTQAQMTSVMPNPVLAGRVMPGLTIPRSDMPDALGSTLSRSMLQTQAPHNLGFYDMNVQPAEFSALL